MRAFVLRRPLVSFFVLAYLGTWVLRSPWWLSSSGLGLVPGTLPPASIPLFQQLGLFGGPFLAAFVITRVTEGPHGVRRLWRAMARFRVHPVAYAVALVAIPLVVAAAYLTGGVPAAGGPLGPALIGGLLVTGVLFILGGPLQEEPGWRGFALPRLQQQLQPTVAALWLGVLWSCWHAPMFLVKEWDTPRSSPLDLVAYLVFVVALSVILAWVFNRADGSVLLAILGHNSVNWSLVAVPALTGQPVATLWPAAAGCTILAVVLVAVTRGRLGFTPPRESAAAAG